MQLKELIPLFDKAIKNKDELKLYEIGFKIACKLAYRYSYTHPRFDFKNVAAETALKLLEVIKKTNWEKETKYYYGVIRKEVYYQFCNYYKNKELSYENMVTDEFGKSIEDKIEIERIESARDTREQVESDFINEVIELADEFKTKDEVFEIMVKKYPKLERAYYLRLVRQYGVQFDTGRTRDFINATKVYNIYKILDEDRNKTRQYLKENNIIIDMTVKTAVSLAKDWLNLFHKDKEKFMKVFVFPPNRSSEWDKIGV